jgi:hypothetical protein
MKKKKKKHIETVCQQYGRIYARMYVGVYFKIQLPFKVNSDIYIAIFSRSSKQEIIVWNKGIGLALLLYFTYKKVRCVINHE